MKIDLAFGVALVGLLLVLSGGLYIQHHRIERLSAEVSLAQAETKAAREAVRVEYRTQTKIRTIFVEAEGAKANVQTLPDPECAKPEPLLNGWRDGIERVRQAVKADDTASGS